MMPSDAEHVDPSLEIEAPRFRVFSWFALEALFVTVWLWSAATSDSWFGRALWLVTAGLQATQWLYQRPLSGPHSVRIDINGIRLRLPRFEKSISWDLIEHVEMRRAFGPMLVIYLKRPDRGSWLRRLDARVNRGRLLPSYYIQRFFSNSDIKRMQSFIDAHYANPKSSA